MVLDSGLSELGHEILDLGGKEAEPLLTLECGKLLLQQNVKPGLLGSIITGDGVIARFDEGAEGKKLLETKVYAQKLEQF